MAVSAAILGGEGGWVQTYASDSDLFGDLLGGA